MKIQSTLRTIFLIATIDFSINTAYAQQALPTTLKDTVDYLKARIPDQGGDVVRWAESCTSPCVLPERFAPGGNGGQFVLAAFVLTQNQKALRVEGVKACQSACTILIDKIASLGGSVCIDTAVSFEVHIGWEDQPASDGSVVPLDPGRYAGAGVQSWIDSHGGLKSDHSFKVVPANIIQSAYGSCK